MPTLTTGASEQPSGYSANSLRSTIAVSTRYVAPRLSACWTHWLRTARRIAPIAPSIKKLLNWALNRGMIDVNPVAGQRMPTKECARDRVLSDDEIERLVYAAKANGYPFGTIYLVLLLTGQRRGEVSAMRWSEIDLQRRLWTIPAARAKNGHAHEERWAEFLLTFDQSSEA